MKATLTDHSVIIESEQSIKEIMLNKVCFIESPRTESEITPGTFQINIAYGTPAFTVIQFKEKQKRDDFFIALQAAISKFSIIEAAR